MNVPSRRVWTASLALALANVAAGLSYLIRPPSDVSTPVASALNHLAGGANVLGILLLSTGLLVLIGWIGDLRVFALIGHGASFGAFCMGAVAATASALIAHTGWVSASYALVVGLGHLLIAQVLPRRPRTDRRQ